MNGGNNQPKNNLTAITVGFFLIVLVTALFFLKSSFSSKKNADNFAKEQAQEEADDLKKYSSISAKELLGKINNRENLEIVDLRDAQNFSEKHIVDSKNISLDELEKNFSFSDKNKNYFIVDELGLTPNEKQAMDIFIEKGLKNVAYLEGGIYNWTNELNPLVQVGNPNSLSDQSKVNYIKSEDLKKTIEQESNLLYIIDLRKTNDYANGHIKNAINIPLENLEARRKEISSYKKIILYDDVGTLAFQGAVRLFDMGILNVYALSDGLNTWKQKGFEVVKQ
ncbi:MAG TPA: rhodanese-like domain-containing protein [Candidatus Moranbacteria bacterium]|nr:rhodanese-like domain-containing protein [Candidatus Moranbacteria bacterium]